MEYIESLADMLRKLENEEDKKAIAFIWRHWMQKIIRENYKNIKFEDSILESQSEFLKKKIDRWYDRLQHGIQSIWIDTATGVGLIEKVIKDMAKYI